MEPRAYTRDGSFKINQEGTVLTSDGYALSPGISHSDTMPN